MESTTNPTTDLRDAIQKHMAQNLKHINEGVENHFEKLFYEIGAVMRGYTKTNPPKTWQEQSEFDAKIDEKNREIRSLHDQLAWEGSDPSRDEKDEEIRRLRKELALRDAQLAQQKNAAAGKEASSKEKAEFDLIIAGKDIEIKQLREELAQKPSNLTPDAKEKEIQKLRDQIALKDALLAQLNRNIVEKEKDIKELRDELSLKDVELSQLKADPTSDERVKQIDELRKKLARKEEQSSNISMDEKDKQIKELRAELDAALANNKAYGVENNRLPDIILKHQLEDKQPYSEYEILERFAKLRHSISQLVKKHLWVRQGKTNWGAYDAIEDKDDRRYFLQAEVADAIATQVFVPDSIRGVWGFGPLVDEALAELEGALDAWQPVKDREKEKAKIVEWRVTTMQFIRRVRPLEVTVHLGLEDYLLRLREYIQPGDKNGLEEYREAVEEVCTKAFEAALAVHGSRYEYLWPQLSPSSALEEGSFDWIDEYCVPKGTTPQMRPRRILFAPVYRVYEDGGRKLATVRHGEALRS